jgi:hypothetical protein
MKKFFVLALTGICCLALAIPAMGQVKMSGMIQMDWNYIDRDEAFMAGGVAPGFINRDNGFETMSFDMTLPLTFMQISYVSKDKVLSGVLRYRLGGSNAGTDATNLYLANMTYRFSDRFSMTFGRQNTILAPMSIPQYGGWEKWGHIVGIGYGNQNHTSLLDGITAEFVLSPMARLQMGIFDPDTDNGEIPAAFGTSAGVPATALREENDLPRFDIALPINWNWLTIIPSFSYLTQEYDQVVSGSDNDVDIWAAALSARATFGPFAIEGEITFGENMGDGNYNAAAFTGFGGALAYRDNAGNWRVAEEDNVAWYISLSWKFGPATLYGIYGQSNMECEGNPMVGLDAAEFDITSEMYGLICPISIGGGFTIQPELMFYDWDDDATVAGAQNIDRGEEMVMSVMFRLGF